MAATEQQKARAFCCCRYCGYLSRKKNAVRRHEKNEHGNSKQPTDEQVSEPPSAMSQVGIGMLYQE